MVPLTSLALSSGRASESFAQPDEVPPEMVARAGLSGPGWAQRVRWIHVAPEGEWRGHESGPFALTRDLFAQLRGVVAQRKTPVSLDYGHGSIKAAAVGSPNGVRASGYLLGLDVRADGLWALCELTRAAVSLVTAGELRFCSGVFLFDAPDRETGETMPLDLHSIALTSTPFIDGQQPIALSRETPFALYASADPTRTRSLDMSAISIDDLTKLLKTKADANGAVTADVIEAALKLLAAGEPEAKAEGDLSAPPADASKAAAASRTVPKATPATPKRPAARAPKQAALDMAPPSGEPAAEDPVDAVEAQIMSALGITDEGAFASLLGSNVDAIVALLQAAVAGEPTDASAIATSRDLVIAELRGQVKVLTDERTARIAAEREARVASVTARIDAAIAAGQLAKDKRAKFVDLARKSPELAAESIDAVVSAVSPTGEDASKVLVPGATALERKSDVAKPLTGVDALVAEGMRALGRDPKGAPIKPAAKSS